MGATVAGVASAQSISLRRYAQDQGLLGLAGTCLMQARDGSILVCTESGLYRFNGQSFSQVPLAGERGHLISSATQDDAGRFWIVSSEHLYVGTANAVRRLTPEETGPLKQGSLMLANPRWGTVIVNDGRVLVVRPQANGGWRLQPLFDAALLARFPRLNNINSAEAHGDALWLGCDGALCKVDRDGKLQVFDQAQGLPRDDWRSVVQDREGGLWVRGMRQVMQLPAGATRFVPRQIPGVGLGAFNRQAQILLDRQGRVVLRTDAGLARWEGTQWRVFGARNGLPGIKLSALLFDQHGDLWMTVGGEGLIRWTGYDWIENWDPSQGMSDAPTWSIHRGSDGRMLLGNEGGVSRERDGMPGFSPWLPGAGLQIVGLQVTADGAVWTANSLGELHRHDAQGRHGRLVAHLAGATKGLYLDHAGRLWVLTMKGLYLVPRPLGDQATELVQALPAEQYTDIVEQTDGTLLVAGVPGVYRLRGTQWSQLQISLDGKPAQPWVDKLLVLKDGNIWASLTSPGLWQGHLQGDTLALRRAQDPQLHDLRVYLIREDRAGRIWVGHGQGLEAYDGRHWSRLTQSQGLLWDDTSESAFFEDRDGSVWVGNSRGLSHVLDPQRLFGGDTPALTLTELSRAGHGIVGGERLPWTDAPLHIEVASQAHYDDRNRVSLRYRFAGLHSQWIYTNNFEIDHPPLAPGDYVLQIQLLDSYRRTASPMTQLAFSVAPVWWRSVPMLLLYLLIALAVTAAALRWRDRQLRRRERILAGLVAQRTHELEVDKRELEIARAALAVKASHDALTGLPNRAGILEALAMQMDASARTGAPLAVAMIDLDHFKHVNDAHGHLVGDAVLCQVGQRLHATMRGADLVGRYGGEELLGVLAGLPMPSHARLQELLAAINSQPVQVDGHTLQITASIGVAWHQPGESLQEVLSRADAALYRAKDLGRNRVEIQLPGMPPQD